VAQCHDKEQPAFLVLEEQVLGVPAGQLALELGAFSHGEHRLVLQRSGGDAELIEAGEQVLSGGGHGTGPGGDESPSPIRAVAGSAIAAGGPGTAPRPPKGPLANAP